MRTKDTILLEAAYDKIFVPRRSEEERMVKYRQILDKKIADYIKGGSQGDLCLGGTWITELPSSLKKVRGTLNLERSKIKTLPDNLIIEGHLYMSYASIEVLPMGLTIGRSLQIAGTGIQKLPPDLFVGESLFAGQTKIEEFPSDHHIANSVILCDSKVKELHPGLRIGGILDIRRTNIRTLPEDIYVRGNIYVAETPLAHYSNKVFRNNWPNIGGRVTH